MVHQQTKVFEWDVNEYEFKKKNRDWYWALGIFAVVGITLTIIFGNYLLTIFIAIATFLIFIYADKKPKKIHVEISEQGVRIKNDLFPYTNLESFWIIYRDNQPSLLLLHVNRLLDPMQITPIDNDIDESQIREWLMQFIEEKEMQEPMTHQFADKIGF